MVVRRERLAAPRAFEGSPAPWGFFEVSGDELQVHIPNDTYAAESALRIAWQLATWRQGGVLAHGCGLRFGARTIAAIGVSGAGKSTLAALSSGPPARATLLSDEIVQLFPDGCCYGTPFRSNAENVGCPDGGPLATLLLLAKGDHERMDRISPAEAIPALASNLYRSATDEVRQNELMRRLLQLVDKVGVHRLTFRKHPAVGPFVADWLEHHAA